MNGEIQSILFWIYFINLIVLIIHEIESAYWQEWNLFKLPGGLTGFLILHLPLLIIVLLGLIEMHKETTWGLICSLILSVSGIFAYFIHNHFIKNGRKEFTLLISKIILSSTLFLSTMQLVLTLLIIF
jgi:hypothetical protein